MDKKFYKNEKFQNTFYAVLIFALLCGVVVTACYLFSRRYYEQIYVSGDSMYPTLKGGTISSEGRNHYGKADKSSRTIDSLSRFDVVITYYPKGWTASDEGSYIIKRVWGLPGEKISLTWSENTYTFTAVNPNGGVSVTTGTIDPEEQYVSFTTPDDVRVSKTFLTCINFHSSFKKRTFQDIQLHNDEYYLMGDNWCVSNDCFGNRSENNYVSRSYLQGKVVQIEGTAVVDGSGNLVDKKPIKGMYNF